MQQQKGTYSFLVMQVGFAPKKPDEYFPGSAGNVLFKSSQERMASTQTKSRHSPEQNSRKDLLSEHGFSN